MTARQGWKSDSDRFGDVQIRGKEMLAGRRGGTRHAIDSGLAAAEWYHTAVARKDIKALMQRSNRPTIRDTIVRNPVTWRWSHARHHTDTCIVGRDPEIALMRPPVFARLIANFAGLVDAWNGWGRMVLNASGRIAAEEASFIPVPEQPKVIAVARVWVLIYAATLALALWMHSILPLMVIGLPRLYGAWHHVMTGLLQHGGLADNVIDHRLNSRTVLMNPVSRFIYWNMNYHVEHHMFPMVPITRCPGCTR